MLPAFVERGPTGLMYLAFGSEPIGSRAFGPGASRAFRGPGPTALDTLQLRLVRRRFADAQRSSQDSRACIAAFGSWDLRVLASRVPYGLTSRDRSSNLTFDSLEPPILVS